MWECSLYHRTIKVDTDAITIVPIADVQVGASGVDLDGLREHVEYARTFPNPRFVGVGDYIDTVSPSNRKLLRAAIKEGKLYDSFETAMLDVTAKYVDEFLTVFEAGDQWDAVLPGHHYWEYVRRVGDDFLLRTTDQDVADAVGAPFMGAPDEKQPSAMLTYSFPPAKKGQPRPQLRVYLRHGQGSGDTFAAPLNQLQKQTQAHVANVYIIAHHHKLVSGKMVKLDENPQHETNLKAYEGALVSAGSWMRGFLKDETTYAEDGQMIPLAVGAPIIKVQRLNDNTFRVKVEL